MLVSRSRMTWRVALYVLLGLSCLIAVYGWARSSDDDGIDVATKAEFLKAIRTADHGVTIRLAPGNYGRVRLQNIGNDLAPGERLVVTSADPCNRATFEQVWIQSSANIILSRLNFADPDFFADPKTSLKPDGSIRYLDLLRTEKTSALSIVDNTFVGPTIDRPASPLNGFAHGTGWRAKDVSDVIFASNRVDNVWKGLSLQDMRSLRIADNLVTDYRSDAIYVAGVQDLTVENNELRYPRPFTLPKGRGDHPDFMQVQGIEGGLIQNNLMMVGAQTGVSQGIFPGDPARDLTVRNNILISRARNGILLANISRSQVTNNLVLVAERLPRSVVPAAEAHTFDAAPQIRVGPNPRDVLVQRNASSAANRRGSVARRVQAGLAGADAGVGPRPFMRLEPGAPEGTATAAGYRRIGDILFAQGTLDAAGIDVGKFAYLSDERPGDSRRCPRSA